MKNTEQNPPEAIPFDECHKLKCWEYGKQPDEEIADGRDTWWTEYWSRTA